MNKIDEIIRACNSLSVTCAIITKERSMEIITHSVNKFNIQKTSGHLSISNEAMCIPTEKYEFSFFKYLNNEPVYMFFDCLGFDRNKVIEIESANKMGIIMEEFGMEYFITNKAFDYLLAVNWYVIEGVGSAENWLKKLIKQQ